MLCDNIVDSQSFHSNSLHLIWCGAMLANDFAIFKRVESTLKQSLLYILLKIYTLVKNVQEPSHKSLWSFALSWSNNANSCKPKQLIALSSAASTTVHHQNSLTPICPNNHSHSFFNIFHSCSYPCSALQGLFLVRTKVFKLSDRDKLGLSGLNGMLAQIGRSSGTKAF